MTDTDEFVWPDGRKIAYRIEGPLAAPPIMLAHGVALDLGLWDDLVATLATDYRVLRYDSRGHGRSSMGTVPFTLSDLADDAIALLDALAIPKVHFVGLSMGAMVGMDLVASHSERLLSASLCNARAAATPAYRQSWDDRIASVRKSGLDAVVDATVSRWFTQQFRISNPNAIKRIMKMILATSPEGYCLSAGALKDLDYAERLHGGHVPLLFVAGAEDSGAPPSVVRALHEATPGSRHVELPGTGHISVIENPAGFRAAITTFINTVHTGEARHVDRER
jgi:3-oxoadipate enol-lactonase